jgi:hypothetical protein
MPFPALLFVSALVLGATLVLGRGALRFRSAWRELAARFGPGDQPSVSIAPKGFPPVYCEGSVGGRWFGSPGFTVDVSPTGCGIAPGLWHRGLRPAWIPRRAVAHCLRANRVVGRKLVECTRLELADGQQGWILIDDPAGAYLFRLWSSATPRAPAGSA